MRDRALVLGLVLGLATTACNLAPAYERPAAPVASQFTGGAGSGLAAADRGWRDVFGDPRLQALIELALRNNRDLRVAVLNVEAAEAQYRIQRSAQLPSVYGLAGVDVAGGTSDVTTGYRVGVGVSAFELDLFGRVRNLSRAALEDYFATVEARRAAHLALVGQVVAQYLRERALDEQRIIAERTVTAVADALAVTQRLFEAGQRSELDVRTFEAQLHAARGEVYRFTRDRAQAENALVLLIGQPLPTNLPAPQPLASQQIVADLPAGLPSEVLLRRPDVLSAEHALRAANANIGVARAAFFPTISLTAFAGLASSALTDLVSGGAINWSVAPQLSVPLFTAGRNRATLEVAKVRTQIEVARYERAIQVAFREVADALVGRATLTEELATQVARVEAERKRYEISEARYKNGIESYLSVLTAQQDLYRSELALVTTQQLRLLNLADLYIALGGGWRERTSKPELRSSVLTPSK